MLRTAIASAFGAALVVGLLVSVLQAFTTEPLIFEAERYESSSVVGHDHDPSAGEHRHEDGEDAEGGWAPADGLERSSFTAVANVVTAFAIALLLWAGMRLAGGGIDPVRGLLWGAAGFAAFGLLPSLGLSPELPGTPAADIVARQTWWLATAAASAAGIALVLLAPPWWARASGLALLLAPHIAGAPAPPGYDVPYPGALAAEFAVASLVVSAALWIAGGVVVGWLYRRLDAAGSRPETTGAR